MCADELFDHANKEWEAGNLKKAFDLFVKAATSGNNYALNSIGYFFDNGIGVAKDTDKALFWYKKAARLGDYCAYSNLGLIYRDLGNIRQAKFWLARASQNGDGDAALELAKLYLQSSDKRSTARAVGFLQGARESSSITEESYNEAILLLEKYQGQDQGGKYLDKTKGDATI